MIVIYILVGIIVGGLLANMTPINADLRNKVGSPFMAITTSLLMASILLAVIALITKQSLIPSMDFVKNTPAFVWFGGFIGALYVTVNVLLFPKVGAVETVVLPLIGQILAGIFIDTFGLLNSNVVPFTLYRAVGTLLLIVGLWIAIVLSNKRRDHQIGTSTGVGRLGWRIFGIVVGGLTAIQQSMNGALGGMLNGFAHRNPTSPLGAIQASFFAFFIGFVAMLIVTLIKEHRMFPTVAQFKTLRPTNFLGGIFNALVGLGRNWLRTATSQVMTAAIVDFGQIAFGLLVQQFGWWNSPKIKINWTQVAGLAVMFIGVLMIVGVRIW
ncbi:MAG: DMT family transporter [Lactobacillaceae bacterium]|jgi:transporter family-2 protein|nr:DMT family transporter [Lactobacillaceae bacterium]